ncbi:MAG: hypothetical protein RSD40_01140 [Bacilli bacterium]|uniref:hypothetical protein n=1 Tax=unclassified Cetobacterium TaxID=2630983 RepID=UPI00163D1D71|nr:hypothetical protein [Cetobacterium sp. 2A]MBC2854926.1 hypothetical protein [Cetobacterium sp. 2A]
MENVLIEMSDGTFLTDKCERIHFDPKSEFLTLQDGTEIEIKNIVFLEINGNILINNRIVK